MAMTFGANSYLNVDGAWTNLTVATITLWVKLNAFNTSANRFIGSDDNWEVRATNDWGGVWRFSNELWTSTVTQPPLARSTTIPVIGTWYHIAATVDATKFGQIFINGVLEASGLGADTATGTTLSIGNRNGAAADQCTNGVLDDVRVYTRVLATNEIETIYACRGSDSIFYGLQNRWLLNEGPDSVVATGAGVIKDCVGARTGTPVNSPTFLGNFIKFRGSKHA
jgi:hypothetical protein